MSLSTPMTECVFLNDSPLKHDENRQIDTDVFKLKENRKRLPAISATTAPGGATADGKVLDELAAQVDAKLGELDALAIDAGLVQP
jgi:hypothetical protein